MLGYSAGFLGVTEKWDLDYLLFWRPGFMFTQTSAWIFPAVLQSYTKWHKCVIL